MDTFLGTSPSNIVYFRNSKAFFEKPTENNPETLFQAFTSYFYDPQSIYRTNDIRSAYTRLFPYKCFWSSCFFCTINSTNPYTYHKENRPYIEACVDFIEQNNVGEIAFGDEAIHVNDILSFAQMIIERNITVIFRFRTRFDMGYTEKACKILAQAGARFC